MKKNFATISTILMLFVYATDAQTALRATADSLFSAKDWKAAATTFDAINVANPNPSVGITFFRAAYAYHQLNDYAKSIINYRRTLEIVPTNTTAMYNIAAAFSKTQERDSALYWLKTLAKTGYSQDKTLETDSDFMDLKNEADFKASLNIVKRNAHPCWYTPQYQQFDFWVGEWEVFAKNGQLAGISKIEQILDRCVLLENWTNSFGKSGKSFNTFNGTDWQQTWVDDSGQLTEYINGVWIDIEMCLRFERTRPFKTATGITAVARMTFFKIGDNEVRQLGEQSLDNEQTWVTTFDLLYKRVVKN